MKPSHPDRTVAGVVAVAALALACAAAIAFGLPVCIPL